MQAIHFTSFNKSGALKKLFVGYLCGINETVGFHITSRHISFLHHWCGRQFDDLQHEGDEKQIMLQPQ